MNQEQTREPLFRTGDKVRVRELADLHRDLGDNLSLATPCGFVDEMHEYCGCIMTVSEVVKSSCGDFFYYHCLEDEEGWNFDECVLEDANIYIPIEFNTENTISYDSLFE